ncbi:hypothetical protein SAMN05443529_10248 [Desulfosporosinus hippei DSM 8344]|uniref:Uncharacterized protein n=1 Tax=Desulfosporosinus hippei DSM 8344 TaxID=1121419 RepID=A0A1G7T0F5_9FIRM|nr:hypothetical protein SAMN05443529_10248 [Desulfosporosinus hippei DSM 8344]
MKLLKETNLLIQHAQRRRIRSTQQFVLNEPSSFNRMRFPQSTAYTLASWLEERFSAKRMRQ